MLLDPVESRPFFNLLTKDLDSIVDGSWDDPQRLELVASELLFRERKAAAVLRDRVTDRLEEICRTREVFLWPSTDAPEGVVPLDQTVFRNERSPLASMGYSVGNKGPTDGARQDILDRAYLGKIPLVNSAAYMANWGLPCSAARLRAMADLIAANIRNRKRDHRRPSFGLAIAEWHLDLLHLKRKFYDGRYDGSGGFAWPSTEISP